MQFKRSEMPSLACYMIFYMAQKRIVNLFFDIDFSKEVNIVYRYAAQDLRSIYFYTFLLVYSDYIMNVDYDPPLLPHCFNERDIYIKTG